MVLGCTHGCQRRSLELPLTQREAMTRSSISSSLLGIALCGAMIALAACYDSTSSGVTVTGPSVLTLVFRAGNGQPAPPRDSAVGGVRTVRVTGRFEGSACGPPAGAAHRDRNLLTLDVEPAVPNPPCDAALVAYNYDATLLGLEPGEYTLEVYHRVDPTAARLLVHSLLITVQ